MPDTLLALAVLALLSGCHKPATVAECAQLSDATAREDCRFDQVKPLLPPADRLPSAADRKALDQALDQALAQIDSPASRDLLLLRLAIAAPAQAGSLCAKVSTDGARDKCQQVIGRPHLGTIPKGPSAP